MVCMVKKTNKELQILVIDDDDGIRQLIHDGLRVHDKSVVVETARDAASGLQKAEDLKPDLILLDLHMPFGNGFFVLNEIRNSDNKDLRTIPIIMLTANDTTGNMWEGLDRGLNDFMGKPFDFVELEARILALLT